jgi:TRAP-type C4-dicarboxylate transport system permease small subunit
MKLTKIVDHLLAALLILIVVSMVVTVAANVFCRFVLNFSLYWGDEVAQILLVWLTFLGAALVSKDASHYSVTFLVDSLPPAIRRLAIAFGYLISILAICILLYFSAEVTWRIADWVMPATGITRSLVYGACPVGCLFMLAYTVNNLINHLQDKNTMTSDTETA